LFDWDLVLDPGNCLVVGSIGVADGVTTLRYVVGFDVLLYSKGRQSQHTSHNI
jgi:hypothetical protein